MPEGDTLVRIADGLRPHLAGQVVTAARARVPGPQVSRVVGHRITEILAVGKNLLVRFDHGLELRTHLRMHGTWHRYRPGEPWRRPAGRAVLVLETPSVVAVCFDAPVVELLEVRAEAVHPSLGRLGPDLLDAAFDAAEALRRLRDPGRAAMEVGPVLLDQRALAGIGNVYKSEVLFIEGVSPFARLGDVPDEALARLVERARVLLRENATRRGGPARVTTRHPVTRTAQALGALWVYGRAGRPCRRCGTVIRATAQGSELPRTTWWCPRCQPGPASLG